MSRFRRSSGRLLLALSLLLGLSAAGLWLSSRDHVVAIEWDGDAHQARVQCAGGVLQLVFANDATKPRADGWRPAGWHARRYPINGRDPRSLQRPTYNAYGFGFFPLRTVGPPGGGNWRFGGRMLLILLVPVWVPIGLSLLLPAWWITHTLRAGSRRRAGLCANCGYDLRASPERCPECGQAVIRSPLADAAVGSDCRTG
ncbi:MAG TPA: hypothetical protein VH475_04150 [Tepidisphaeraceae bacterium]|jgi:hypothetical protein